MKGQSTEHPAESGTEHGICHYSIPLGADVTQQTGMTAGVLRRVGSTPGMVERLRGLLRLGFVGRKRMQAQQASHTQVLV